MFLGLSCYPHGLHSCQHEEPRLWLWVAVYAVLKVFGSFELGLGAVGVSDLFGSLFFFLFLSYAPFSDCTRFRVKPGGKGLGWHDCAGF